LYVLQFGFQLSHLDVVPFGVALPLRQALSLCRHSPPSDWPAAAYDLIDRQDLAALKVHSPSSSVHRILLNLCWFSFRIQRGPQRQHEAPSMSTAQMASNMSAVAGTEHTPEENADTDGLKLMEKATSLRFGRDRRVKEVCRLLR
jgi:anaphase-promoting complex subunit 1